MQIGKKTRRNIKLEPQLTIKDIFISTLQSYLKKIIESTIIGTFRVKNKNKSFEKYSKTAFL